MDIFSGSVSRKRHNRRDLQAARNAYAQSLTMRPDDAKRLRWFAYLEWKLGNRRAAIDALQRAIQADPSFLDAYGRLSREQLRLGQWRAALRTINALVEQPNYDAARYSLDDRRVVVCIVLPLVAVVSLVLPYAD